MGVAGCTGGLVRLYLGGLSLTVFYDALNRRVPGDFWATVNSLVSLGVRGVFILSGPALGMALDSRGIGFTLVVLACVFAPLFLLVIVGLTNRIRREWVVAPPQPAH